MHQYTAAISSPHVNVQLLQITISLFAAYLCVTGRLIVTAQLSFLVLLAFQFFLSFLASVVVCVFAFLLLTCDSVQLVRSAICFIIVGGLMVLALL